MKIKTLSMLLLVAVLTAAGCTYSSNKQARIAEEQNKPIVYASIYPMYDFTKNIGRDRIDLRMVVPPGAEPHDWEPTARLMAQMEEADVFIYNGVGMELWVDNMLASLANEKLVVVEASAGIPLLKLGEHGHSSEVHTHEPHEHEYGSYDPHVWLDPVRAVKQAQNIMDALIWADRSNAVFYQANFKEFSDKLTALDTLYKDTLSQAERKEIVVAHAAFGYLADRYGLVQISVNGLSPQQEPSAAQLVRITQLLREKNIKHILFETLTSPKLAEVLANEVKANIEILNPIGGLTQQEMQQGKDYLILMEENLDTLKKVLDE